VFALCLAGIASGGGDSSPSAPGAGESVTGIWPGAIVRNLWIGTGTRPPSLGSAVSDYEPY
jgi:hypothetical protein